MNALTNNYANDHYNATMAAAELEETEKEISRLTAEMEEHQEAAEHFAGKGLEERAECYQEIVERLTGLIEELESEAQALKDEIELFKAENKRAA